MSPGHLNAATLATFALMRSLSFLAVLLPLAAATQPPPGFYDATFGLSGPELRQALYSIISGHNVLSNSQLWGAFESTDDKMNGTVWDIYSDVPGGQPPYVFHFVEDQCGTYNSEGDCFNREHSFPQSWYNDAAPMSTDLFHIYPADAWVNQQRGNWPFGTVANADWTSLNGGKRGPCSWPGCSGTVFEPIDAYKGDLARSYFYMLTRYLPQLGSWSTPMMSGNDFSAWAESLLLSWHVQDPVSQKEIDRNNAVFALQHNRNPFIDAPEWAHAIWGPMAMVTDHTTMMPVLWYADGIIHLQYEGSTSAELMIHDATGRVVSAHQLRPGESLMDVDLAAGAYIATMIADGQHAWLRFVR